VTWRALARRPGKSRQRIAAVEVELGTSLGKIGSNRQRAIVGFNRFLPLIERHQQIGAIDIGVDEVLLVMAEAEFGRGIVLRDQTQFEEAVQCFDRAIELNRNDAVRGLFHSHRAEALNLLGRFPEAFADVSRCLEVAPNDDQVLFAVSLIELLHGRWREAWPKYERRIALKVGIPEDFSPPPWPPWRGERLEHELLLLRGEQGFGDHLLFSCFATHLAKLGHRVAVWTKPSLVPLLRTVPGVERVVSDVADLHGPNATLTPPQVTRR